MIPIKKFLHNIFNLNLDLKFILIAGFIFSNLVGYAWALIFQKYNGDFLNSKVCLNLSTLTLIIALISFEFILIYIIYVILDNRLKINPLIKNPLNSILYYVLTIVLIINFAITYFYNFPIAGQSYNYSFAFLITRLKIVDAIIILYCMERTNKNKPKIFWLLVFGAILLNIYRGWTSHIYFFIAIEVLIFFNSQIKVKYIFVLFFLAFSFIFLLYPKIYETKIYIRTKNHYQVSSSQAINHLSGRFSHFSNVAKIMENKERIKVLYYTEDWQNFFLKETLATIIPDKYIRGYNENKSIHTYMVFNFDIVNFRMDTSPKKIKFITGIIGRLIAISYTSICESIIYILFVLIIISLNIIICKKLNPFLTYYSFLNILYYTLSGYTWEIISPLIQVVFWGSIILLINFLSKKIHPQNIKQVQG